MSFTKAAAAARVSQPTLTRQIISLEKAYGVSLLDRTTSRVSLTQEGHRLLELVTPVFEHLSEVESYLKTQHTRSIQIDAVLHDKVTAMLSLAYRSLPSLRFEVTVGSSTAVLGALLDRRADFGVLTLGTQHPELQHFCIDRGKIVAIARPDHPFHKRGTISIRELNGERVILGTEDGASRQLIDANFALYEIRPTIVQVVNSKEIILDLVERGEGVGVIGYTGMTERKLGLCVEFEEDTLSIDVHFACRKERLRSQPFTMFFELIRHNFEVFPAPRGAVKPASHTFRNGPLPSRLAP